MAVTGKQSPLGVNVLGSLLQNIGMSINPVAESYMGVSKSTDGTYTPGKLVNDTCLLWLTYAINDAYTRGSASQTDPVTPAGPYTVDSATYNNLISIGKTTMPSLGNSPPDTWITEDPSNVWVNKHTDFYKEAQAGAPANAGYPFYNWTSPAYNDSFAPGIQPVQFVSSSPLPITYIGDMIFYVPDGKLYRWDGTAYTAAVASDTTNKQNAYKTEGQLASWYPFLATVEDPDNLGTYLEVPNRMITQWGWIRCIALQAYNEFNYNGETATGTPAYKDFLNSFMIAEGFINTSNQAIYSVQNSQDFLQGIYSNQDDLMSGDISGVSLASKEFGQDLANLGNAVELQYIKSFGLPSNLLKTLQVNKALTQSVILVLLAAGLTQTDIENISTGLVTATKTQEQQIYSAFLAIEGQDLFAILVTLNCRTKNLVNLSDLLDVKKMFPTSYQTLTVPIYNTNPNPTNSKTYYPLFSDNSINSQLTKPSIRKTVGNLGSTSQPNISEPNVRIPRNIEMPDIATDLQSLSSQNANKIPLQNTQTPTPISTGIGITDINMGIISDK
jgi:hypothetical protein